MGYNSPRVYDQRSNIAKACVCMCVCVCRAWWLVARYYKIIRYL